MTRAWDRDPVQEAAAELGIDKEELAGTFPPAFLRRLMPADNEEDTQ